MPLADGWLYSYLLSFGGAAEVLGPPQVRAGPVSYTHLDVYKRQAQEGGDASANGQSLDVYLFVPEEPDRLSQFVTLQNRKSKVPAEFEEDAVLLTEKAAERLGVAVGDTITVQRNDDHRQAEFRCV